jgi:hypothetical protein
MIASIDELIDFLKRYHRHWMDDPALDASLIPSDVPAGLASIYRELGGLLDVESRHENNYACPFGRQDRLHRIEELVRIDGEVSFLTENQAVWTARFPVGPADPPVLCDADLGFSDPPNGHVVVCDSLNRLLVTYCLHEAVLGSRRVGAIEVEDSIENMIALPVQPLWLDGPYVYGEPYHFYSSADEQVLFMHMGTTYWVGSHSVDPSEVASPGVEFHVI